MILSTRQWKVQRRVLKITSDCFFITTDESNVVSASLRALNFLILLRTPCASRPLYLENLLFGLPFRKLSDIPSKSESTYFQYGFHRAYRKRHHRGHPNHHRDIRFVAELHFHLTQKWWFTSNHYQFDLLRVRKKTGSRERTHSCSSNYQRYF